MKKELLVKTLVIGIILLFICMSVYPSTAIDNVKKSAIPIFNGNTLYVGGSGPGNYTRIQDAIDNSSDGDTVYVYNRTYYEYITVDKQLSIIGIPSISEDIPFIDGGDEITVLVTADNCIFNHFKIGSDWSFGILLQSDGNIIQNCSVVKASSDIKLYHASNNLITNNVFRGGGQGILLESSSNNTIKNNIADSHKYSKCKLWSESNYNLVRDNIFSNSVYWEGIINRKNCSYNIYKNNTIWNNKEVGIYIESGYGISIIENSFMNNGIAFSSSTDELLSYTIENNSINDKQIYFYKSKNDIIVPSDGGQIFLVKCKNFEIKNLNISKVKTGYSRIGGGICLIESSQSTIQGNTISSCTPLGIYLINSDENTISSNNLVKNHGGIFLDHSDGNSVLDNMIQEGGDEGIYLFYSSRNNIRMNTVALYPECVYLSASRLNIINENKIMNKLLISSMSDFNQIIQNRIQGGVVMRGGSLLNTFKYNDISNADSGIFLDIFCNSNKFVNNNITNNEVGIRVINSRLNTFKKNNFINNGVNAYFEDVLFFSALPDFWRRNYWDDWNGISPKRIEGKLIILHFSVDPDYPVEPTVKPWLNFDWFPAKEPYDIPIWG